MTKALSTTPSARSNGLDDIDGGPERRVYTQMRGIEQVRVWCLHEGGGGAPGIALVAPQEVGQNLLFVGHLPARPQFAHAPGGAYFWRRHDEELHVSARRNNGADIAAVEHRPGWPRREAALID